MKEELIKVETAKLAKEKGLNIDVNNFYINGNVVYWMDLDHTKNTDSVYLAPTQSLLQKWLREEHNLYFGALPIVHNDVRNKASYFRPTKNDCCMYNFKRCNTYEEALEKGLIEALKLIDK